jgi:MOSC domain-containing protein YiiM
LIVLKPPATLRPHPFREAPAMHGHIETIHLRATKHSAPVAVPKAEVIAGRGLVGDRKLLPEKDAFRRAGDGVELTLIEAEALEAATREYGVAVSPGDSRRNVITRGAYLNHLVGRTFRIGGARLRGVKLCEPCGHLARLTCEDLRKALVHRGGLRCDVLEGGTIAVGDAIVPE